MRNFKSKIYISLIALASLVSLNSCNDDDFLDRKPLGTAAEGDLPAGGFEEKAFGLYGKMRTQAGVSDWDRFWFQNIRSEDAMKGSDPGDSANRGNIMDGFAYSPTEFAANWDGHYSLIYACNDLIYDVDNSGKTDSGTLTNKAEAMVIRGWAYFELRRDYGEVPIVLNKIITPSDGIKAKSPIADVDAQIIKDLDFAAANLPLSWPTYPGRATSGFANSILAKLYLTQGNWTKALEKAEIVINSGQYALFNSYETLFKEQGDNCIEAIFEVQFLRQDGVNYSNNYFESQGVRGSGVWDLGWGFNVPTQTLVNAYESGDPRMKSTILFQGQDDGFGTTIPSGLAQPMWNKKAYSTPSYRNQQGIGKNHWFNVKIIRYADVLLMAAEASYRLGNLTKAADYVNQVRTRARGTNAGLLPNVPADGNLLTAIKRERRIELAMEGERFYDLVRWGDAVTVLGPLGYQDKNKYYPIPQTAIDQSGGVLVQNPNY